MDEHANVELVRRGYAALNQGDVETLLALLADDVVWRVPGRSTFAGIYRGREAALAYLGGLDELTGGTYHAELIDVVGRGDLVISIDRSSAQRGNVSYDDTEVVVFRFRDGKVVEAQQSFMDQYGHDRLFA